MRVHQWGYVTKDSLRQLGFENAVWYLLDLSIDGSIGDVEFAQWLDWCLSNL